MTGLTKSCFHRTATRCLIAVTAGGLLVVAAHNSPQASKQPFAEPVVDSDFYNDGRPSAAKVELGRQLFFDKILSGNRNISCAACHDPSLGSGDGLSLSIGEGGEGLGVHRHVSIHQPVLGRVPRNAQPLYFVGAKSYTSLFHDGRVEVDSERSFRSGFWTPAREQLPKGLDNVLAAQAMFPVLSPLEMAGHKGENAVATAVALDRLDGADGAWELLANRLRAIPAYVNAFRAAFDDIGEAHDLTFVHVANAIAAFEATAFRADQSPFDHYLRSGNTGYLTSAAQRGMDLFYGKADCVSCHSGKFQTDNKFHAIAMAQIGPGKEHGEDTSYWRATGYHNRVEDEGRYRVTFSRSDMFRFRTPSLRNVTLTGPWGHSGAYTKLADVVRHHFNPVTALNNYQPDATSLPPLARVIEQTGIRSTLIFSPIGDDRRVAFSQRDTWVQQNTALRSRIAQANELKPLALDANELNDLLAFLEALTDPNSRDQLHLVPTDVPSGLPVAH